MRVTNWLQPLTPRQKARLPYLVLVLSVFAAYADVYHNAFVWDDMSLVVSNGSLRHWGGLIDIFTKTTLGPYYRPLQALVYFFVYQIFGLSQAAFHGINILIHALNVCLVYRLGFRLGFYKRASFAGALLWGVHPLWIEIVAVVAGTADLLVVTFLLTGLLVLLPAFKPRRFWLAGLFFILAICSKEHAVVLPARATFTLFLVNRERLKPAVYIRTWPLWLLAAAYIIGFLMCPVLNNLPSYVDQNATYVGLYEHNIVNRILTALATLPVYLGLMLTPANLHLAWNFPIYTLVGDWHVITGIAIVAATLLHIFLGRGKRGLPLTWGLLWFAAALSPYTGILKPVDGQFFEHWIYLPAIGFFWACPRRRRCGWRRCGATKKRNLSRPGWLFWPPWCWELKPISIIISCMTGARCSRVSSGTIRIQYGRMIIWPGFTSSRKSTKKRQRNGASWKNMIT